MIKMSEEFHAAFKDDYREIFARITIKDTVYDNDNLTSIEYDGGSITGDSFSIGSTFSNSIKIIFCEIIEGLTELDEVKLEWGIRLEDGTIEYCPMGIFLISEAVDVDWNENKTTVECMDRMIMLEGTYESELTYPAPIREVALEIANMAGVEVNVTSFARLSANVIAKPIGYTYRQSIGLIAQFEGGFATFDRDGLLDIRMLNNTDFQVSPDEYFLKGLVKNELMYRLGGIQVTIRNTDTEETTLQVGATAGSQILLENNVMTQNLLNVIYGKLEHLNYYPFTLNWRGNPALEAGDWIEMVDREGNIFKAPNLSYKLTFKGGLTAESSAETTTQSDVLYEHKGNLNQKIEWLNGLINSMTGNATYYGIDEPKAPKDGDTWFKPNGPDWEIWVYQDGEWVFKISSAVDRELLELIEQAKEAAQNAEDKANQSLQVAEDSKEVAQDAFDAFNNLDINVRNLVAMSNVELFGTDSAKITSKDHTFTFTDTQSAGLRLAVVDKVRPSTEYIFGFYMQKTAGEITVIGGHDDLFAGVPSQVFIDGELVDGSFYWGVPFPDDYEEHKVLIKFKTVNNFDAVSDKYLYIQPNRALNNAVYSAIIRNIHLNAGNKDTGWQPSPEDVQEQIVEVTELANGIKTTVAIMEDDLEVAKTEIITLAEGHQITVERVDGLQTDVATVTQIATGIQQTVAVMEGDLEVAKTQITQLSNQYSVIVTELDELGGTVQANFTILSNMIDLRVEKDGIIHAINISDESITIMGDRLHITAQTYIDDAVITSAMIEELSADKLTVGSTLDAANINVINLNVSSLTGNTTTFVQTSWNSIYASVQMTSSGLSVMQSGVLRSRLNVNGLMINHDDGTEAGGLTWSRMADQPTRTGILLKSSANSYVTLASMEGATSGLAIRKITMDGNTGIVDCSSLRLLSYINANGYGFSGNVSFTGSEDAVFSTTKTVRLRTLGTTGYETNRNMELRSQSLDGNPGIAILNPAGTGGFWIGENGRVAYQTQGSWKYLS